MGAHYMKVAFCEDCNRVGPFDEHGRCGSCQSAAILFIGRLIDRLLAPGQGRAELAGKAA